MKASKIIFTFLIIFAAVQFCFGQENPRAVLQDRLGELPCDQFLSRLDSFFVELMKDPSSTGYAVISFGERSLEDRFTYENWINTHILFRKFPKDRLKLIEADRGNTGLETEFWTIPVGADKPPIIVENEGPLPPPARAVRFGDTGGDICAYFYGSQYIKYLQAYPELKAHIVIYNNSARKARKEGDGWIKSLVSNKIARNRIRIFHSKEKSYPYEEFWLVPSKKK